MRTTIAYTVPPQGAIGSLNYLMNRNFLKCVHGYPSGRYRADNKRLTRILFPTIVEPKWIGRQINILDSQCKFCPTEFQCSLEQFDNQQVMLFITRWQDIGTGLSPTELSPLVGSRGFIGHIRGPRKRKKLTYESPRAQFDSNLRFSAGAWKDSLPLRTMN